MRCATGLNDCPVLDHCLALKRAAKSPNNLYLFSATAAYSYAPTSSPEAFKENKWSAMVSEYRVATFAIRPSIIKIPASNLRSRHLHAPLMDALPEIASYGTAKYVLLRDVD
jgi:hypothetical protein